MNMKLHARNLAEMVVSMASDKLCVEYELV